MTKHRVARTLGGALLVLIGVAWGLVRAEVSADRRGGTRVDTLLMDKLRTITDGADPIPQVRWEPYRPLTSDRLLNESGAIRPDGPPDLAYLRESDWPIVVWSYRNDTDHDIAYAFWTEVGWSAVSFLTSGPENELDPRVFVDPTGAVHVTWWVEAAEPYVMLAVAANGTADLAAWSIATRVSPLGQQAARPTVSVFQGVRRVAYETIASVQPTLPLVEVLREGPDGFESETSFGALRQGDRSPVFHVEGPVSDPKLWLDWKHSDHEMAGASFRNGAWGAATLHPWVEDHWLGVELARLLVRRAVLNPGVATPPTEPGGSPGSVP